MAVDPLFAAVARSCLCLLFLSGAVHKASDYPRFQASVSAYRLLPGGLSASVAPILLAAELTLGLALLMGIAIPLAATGALLILGLYLVAMAFNIARGKIGVDCGCSFSRGATLSAWHLLRNTVLLGTATLLLLPQTDRHLGLLDAAQVVTSLTAFSLLYLSADGLLSNRSYWVRE